MKNIQVLKPIFRKDQIIEHISECLDVGWTGVGFKTVEFEEAWKHYTNLPNAHFINSNTVGLHLAVRVLKYVNQWKDGDEIITTPLTFVSTNHSILYENMKPVFTDVDDQLCLDPKLIEQNITRKTRAVIFVGIGGNIGKYKEVVELCKKYKLKLILDAAHMAGTKMDRMYHGVAVSKSQVGWDADVTVFSFQAVKNLPTADSGMICFKNDDYDQLVRKMTWLGIDKDTFSRTNSKGNYKWDYDVSTLGYKYHGNSIMASMGLVGLKYLDGDNEHRRTLASIYDKELKEVSGVQIVKHNSECESSRHLYQVRVSHRDDIMVYLNDNGIFPGVHYKDNTEYDLYKDSYGSCPNATKYSKELITLPIHCDMAEEDCKRVVTVLKQALKKWK